jgi:putative ABC transport system substrate-binding protein
MPKIGQLTWFETGPYAELTNAAFVQGLKESGFEPGKNVILLRRSAEGDFHRFNPLVRELSREGVSVYFAPVTSMARETWRVDHYTPTVIALIADPVEMKFVKSLARPGTQVTGIAPLSNELTGKRLQLLAELVPGLRRIGVLVDEYALESCHQEYDLIYKEAKALNIAVTQMKVRGRDDMEAAFERARGDKVQAIVATLVTTRTATEVEANRIAAKYRLPLMSFYASNVKLGGLIAYGPDTAEIHRMAGHYVARILKGEKPAEMALDRPREFQLVLNLKTARDLGINVPQTLLLRATEVIQ